MLCLIGNDCALCLVLCLLFRLARAVLCCVVYLRLCFLLSVVFDCYVSLRSLVLCLMIRILSGVVFDWFRFFALFCFVFDVTLANAHTQTP